MLKARKFDCSFWRRWLIADAMIPGLFQGETPIWRRSSDAVLGEGVAA